MKRTDLKIKPGPGGWVEATWPDGKAWVRFDLDEENKLTQLAQVSIPNPRTDVLRRVPLGRIEAAVRAHLALQIALAIRREETPPADFAGIDFLGDEGLSEPPRYRLRRPQGRRLDDAFYKRVARAYREATIRGLQPRQVLAKDAGVSPDTVAGWVMEARDREYLPRTTPGKVTA